MRDQPTPPKSHIALQRQHDRHVVLVVISLLLSAVAILLTAAFFGSSSPDRAIPGPTSRELVYVTRPPEYRTVVVTATASVAPYYAGVPDSYSNTPAPQITVTPSPSARYLSVGVTTNRPEVGE